jgi:tetraacyldisaccharide 4'-kinase
MPTFHGWADLRAEVTLAASRALESGAGPFLGARRAVASATQALGLWNPSRASALRASSTHSRVIGVGGATLGGSSRTPIAIAIAAWFAEQRQRVALLVGGHGGALARGATVEVQGAGASSRIVGDEAVMAKRRLPAVAVFASRSRSQALGRLAASRAFDVVVVDGLLQTEPSRLSLSVLALHASRPWGAGAVPPLGDLRASPDALVAACDVMACVGEAAPSSPTVPAFAEAYGRPLWRWDEYMRIARNEEWSPAEVLGLLVSVARPERVIAGLARLGIQPRVVVRAVDHAPAPSLRRARTFGDRGGVTRWLATAKCLAAPEMERATVELGAPIDVISHEVVPVHPEQWRDLLGPLL